MLAAAALVAGCGGGDDRAGAPAPDRASGGVVELDRLEPISQRFEADAGKPRLLLILSPT